MLQEPDGVISQCRSYSMAHLMYATVSSEHTQEAIASHFLNLFHMGPFMLQARPAIGKNSSGCFQHSSEVKNHIQPVGHAGNVRLQLYDLY